MKREVIAEFSASSLVHNYQIAKRTAPDSEVYAVVKANAYGHGMDWVTGVLRDVADGFVVATMDEGVQCRAAAGDLPVLVLQGAFNKQELSLAGENRLQLVIHSVEQLDLLEKAQLEGGKDLCQQSLWFKLNTGMNRLGFQSSELGRAVECVNSHESYTLLGVLTHFASADIVSKLNQQQLDRFSTAVSTLKYLLAQAKLKNTEKQSQTLSYIKQKPSIKLKCSAANSAALLDMPEAHLNMVRPGIMLYGASPFEFKTASEFELKPVMILKARVIAIQKVAQGDSVGYGESWRAEKNSLIAVIGIGYGDGYPRSIDASAQAQIGDDLFPVVGRVSMDTITLDISGQKKVSVGDEVIVWGDQFSAENLARSANTISYELFCKLTNRVQRRCIDG